MTRDLDFLDGFRLTLESIDPFLPSFSPLLEPFHWDVLFLYLSVEVTVDFLLVLLGDSLGLEPRNLLLTTILLRFSVLDLRSIAIPCVNLSLPSLHEQVTYL